jgi:hypothetical protein
LWTNFLKIKPVSKSWTTYKKLHKWPGLIISIILIWYGISGIIMNHRELLSGIDLSRHVMPDIYEYNNWNNAALKGNVIINSDSILVYGNIGVWLTDSTFKNYTSFNTGFPKGSDNRKISDLLVTTDHKLYASALTGLYSFDRKSKAWKKLKIDDKEERFTGLEIKGDTLLATNRSHLFIGLSAGTETKLKTIILKASPGSDNKITLFQTIWQIHSGEIFGISGKIYVDALGLIVIFLSVTGIIWFFYPSLIKRKIEGNIDISRTIKTGKWSLKWHNKIGAWTFVLVIILFLSGIFLRPPLLIAIANARVHPLKYSHLDQPNPWYDKLRDILYDPDHKMFLLAASDGLYHFDPESLTPIPFENQPPISVMGINVFEKYNHESYLVGSFSGLFLWDPHKSAVLDFVTGEPYRVSGFGRPVGEYAVTGLINNIEDEKYLVDYRTGTMAVHHDSTFPAIPDNIINESKISLWNVCLEIHTGRIFEKITGDFYILIVPLVGIAGIIVVFSGYVLWRRKYRNT